MSWNHVMNTYHLKSANSYADALEQFEKNKLVHRTDPSKRWLNMHTRSHWVQHDEHGNIGYWLGSELVTFQRTNEIIVRSNYGTPSTRAFVNAVLPRGVSIEDEMVAIEDEGTTFWRRESHHDIRLARNTGRWAVASPTKPFRVPTLDKKAASAALRASNAHAFHTWATAIIAMGHCETHIWERDNRGNLPLADLLPALADSDRWMDILTSRYIVGYTKDPKIALNRIKNEIKQAVYSATPNVIKVDEYPSLCGYKTVETWRRAVRTYGYALHG